MKKFHYTIGYYRKNGKVMAIGEIYYGKLEGDGCGALEALRYYQGIEPKRPWEIFKVGFSKLDD